MPIDSSRQSLRLAIGASTAFGVGQLVGWRMAFVVPILAVSLLKLPQAPTLRAGAGFILVIAATFALALLVLLPLMNYPLAAMIAVVLSLFWAFYVGHRGFSPFVVLVMLLAITLVPVLGLESIELSIEVSLGLAQSALLAVVFTWLAFYLVPAAQVRGPTASQAHTAPAPVYDAGRQVRLAWAATLVVSPLLLVILYFGLVSCLLVLVFVTLLSIQPDLRRGVAGGIGLIAGNLLGGSIAIVVYELVVVLPNLLFLTLMIALVCLLLGRRMFAGGAAGIIFGTALTTVLLIIGTTVAPIGPEAGAKFLDRIVQVTAAALYVAGGFVLVSAVVSSRIEHAPTQAGVIRT